MEDFSQRFLESQERSAREREAFERLPPGEQRDQIIPKIIKNYIYAGPDDATDHRRSLCYRLLADLINDGISRGMAVTEAAPEAGRIVSVIQNAVVPAFTKDAEKILNFWTHVSEHAKHIRGGGEVLNRDPVEAAAATYLKSALRSQEVDRLLVDLLIAQEYFAYAQRVHYRRLIVAPHESREHPLNIYLRGRAWSAVGAAILAGIGITICRWLNAPGLWQGAVLVGVGTVFITETVSATRWLITVMIARAKGLYAPTSGDLIRMMCDLCCDLNSAGLISATYIRERAKETADKGVGWPSTLFALLDDIVSRSGRF